MKMAKLVTNCWAPCFTIRKSSTIKLEAATAIIAIYTGLIHLIVFFYGIYIIDDGRTDTFYSPIFEFNHSTNVWIAIAILIYSGLFIACGSIGLLYGLKSETRFFYLPWLYATSLEILLMEAFGFFMVYRYYHYLWATFAALILWSYSAYHLYLFWVVLSQYYYLKDIQEPTFIILHP